MCLVRSRLTSTYSAVVDVLFSFLLFPLLPPLGHSLLERYGMTEVGMALTNPYRGVRKEGTVGRPFAGMEVLIDCSDGHEEGANADAHTQEFVQGPGELLVRGPSVFAEYFNKKTATQESFIESVRFVITCFIMLSCSYLI